MLASSEACKNQGFWMGERILSLQFHVEVTEAMVWNMVSEGRDELKRSPFVQSEDAILSKARDLRPAGDLFFKLLRFGRILPLDKAPNRLRFLRLHRLIGKKALQCII